MTLSRVLTSLGRNPSLAGGHSCGARGRRLGPTVSREVTSTSRSVSPLTRTPRGLSPGGQTARSAPDLAIESDLSTFSALARIIAKESSGDRFSPGARCDDVAVPATRSAVLADTLGRLLDR